MPRSLKVSELTKYIQTVLTTDPILRKISVEGEVVNARNGRFLYFDLREGDAIISGVQFERLPGEYVPKDGDQVTCEGRIGVYGRQSKYQFICSRISPIGRGDALLRFEELKKRLFAEGLFDASKKKPIPVMPKRIGVITSLSGAVIHDIINELTIRYPLVTLICYDSLVQGSQAATSIRQGILAMSALPTPPDVLIVARGGGSSEHLEVFHDEALVRSIAQCPIPIITAIGHQVDDTLADLAADRRASTPTEAAVIATPSREELHMRIEEMRERAEIFVHKKLDKLGRHLVHMETIVEAYRPDRALLHDRKRVELLVMRLESQIATALQTAHKRVSDLERQVDVVWEQVKPHLSLHLVHLDGKEVFSEEEITAGSHYVLRTTSFESRILVENKLPASALVDSTVDKEKT